MGKFETCYICHTEIDWNGGDEKLGNVWYCEKCGKTFCESCFIKSINKEVLSRMIDSEGDTFEEILCPECSSKENEE